MSIRPEAARLLTQISRLLAAGNIRAYIVGGFVRDTLLERATADVDIGVGADALELARYIAASLEASYVPLDDINQVGRVVLPGNKWYLDFSTLKGKTIEEDLARRDFTINAMAYPLDENISSGMVMENIIDPFQGRTNLEHRNLKALNGNVFKDDAARLLRALRIAAELHLNIDTETENLMAEDALLIRGVAGERIRGELLRLLALPGAGKRLFLMDSLGLLTALIPELAPARELTSRTRTSGTFSSIPCRPSARWNLSCGKRTGITPVNLSSIWYHGRTGWNGTSTGKSAAGARAGRC